MSDDFGRVADRYDFLEGEVCPACGSDAVYRAGDDTVTYFRCWDCDHAYDFH